MEINESIFSNFPVLQTSRITLRELTFDDAKKILTMRSNGMIGQLVARLKMNSLSDAEELVEKSILLHKTMKGIAWAGVLRDSNEVIGTCGFNSIDRTTLRAEIGGELSTEHWGKKMAGEAIYEVLKFGFNVMNLQSVEAKVSPGNQGAITILKQMGFRHEALFKRRIYFNGKYSDVATYSLHKGEQSF